MRLNVTYARGSYEEYREKASRQYGYVYLLRCAWTGFYKVGWTLKSPAGRLEQIRAEFRNGFDWQIRGAIFCFNPPQVEEALHVWLDHARVTDKREWFVPMGPDATALEAIFAKAPPVDLDQHARQEGYAEGWREGVEAGRHLAELDRLDETEWAGFTWEQQYERETEGSPA